MGELSVSVLFHMAGVGQTDTVNETMVLKLTEATRLDNRVQIIHGHGLKAHRIFERQFIADSLSFPLVWRKIDTM